MKDIITLDEFLKDIKGKDLAVNEFILQNDSTRYQGLEIQDGLTYLNFKYCLRIQLPDTHTIIRSTEPDWIFWFMEFNHLGQEGMITFTYRKPEGEGR